jgi:hypothetical protein
MNQGRRPLRRFWHFPRGLKAVVVMTGDDHGNVQPLCRHDRLPCHRAELADAIFSVAAGTDQATHTP